MPNSALRLAAIGFLLVTRCVIGQTGANTSAPSGVESIYTSLNAHSCKEVTDENDPNDLTYQVCAGVAGYQLQVRPIESGRLSINVVTPAKRVLYLNYGQVVTHSMDGVDEKAEWRVRKVDGKVLPIALIVRVQVHGNLSNPEKITQVYWTIAKLGDGKACVTDRILEGSRSVTEVRAMADSASGRSCAARLR